MPVYPAAMEGTACLGRASALSRDGGGPPVEPADGEPFVSCAPDAYSLHWSQQLEQLHEQSSRTHFIDVWTRRAMLAHLGDLPPAATAIDIGCSTGYLLADLRAHLPDATLIGVDLLADGLRKAHTHVPDALLVQGDVCALPLHDACVDVAVSANLLEHVPHDERALAEILRTLRPGARAVIVVPMSPGSYDYYDRLLGHQRRYARGELARKASRVGFEVLDDVHLGAPLFPAFWAVKRYNRRRHHELRERALERKVQGDIQRTAGSRLGHLACRLEEQLLGLGVRLPFGIRGLTVLRRPRAGT